MTRLILQTSKIKPRVPRGESLDRFANGWDYAHFDDDEILDFFKNNPIPGFENIEKRFKEIRRGEHRADLFRYYYIYLNGGFFIDSDFELTENLDDVVKGYELVTAVLKSYETGAWGTTNRSRAFNGYMYAAKTKNPIVFQCLQHLYHIDITDLGPDDGGWDSRYHSACEYFYNAIQAYPDKDKIKLFSIIDEPYGSFILDGETVLGRHNSSLKDGVELRKKTDKEKLDEEEVEKDYYGLKENPTTSTEPILYYCGVTATSGINSGIQRYVRKTAKALIDLGADLIPVKINGDELIPLSSRELMVLENFDGPSLESWYRPIYPLYKSAAFKKTSKLIYPEIAQDFEPTEVDRVMAFAKIHKIQVMSIFHDAIAYLLKDHYSEENRQLFLKYMQDISQSDIVLSVSNNSRKDYDSIITSPKNMNMKTMALLLPHNIGSKTAPDAKINRSKDINILCVSAMESRKNHIRLLEAYYKAKGIAKKRGYNLNLTLVAAYSSLNPNTFNNLQRLCSRLQVKIIMNASEEQLLNEYKNADFTVYPSVYEGYGIPIVESLELNTPVICSNTSSMKEIADIVGCPTFNPLDSSDIARAILEMATNSDMRESLLNNIKNVKPYTWKDYSSNILKMLYSQDDIII